MYLVWKSRPLSAARPCERCGDRSAARVAHIPHLVESERVDGRVRQRHLARLPSIRSCCLRSKALRAAWWAAVDPLLDAYDVSDYVWAKLAHKVPPVFDDDREASPSRLTPTAAAAVLGIAWPCPAGDLKAAFRRRAKETHPDLGGMAEEFRVVAEAYEFLRQVAA